MFHESLLCLVCTALLRLLLQSAFSQTVTVHSDVVGQTPDIIGLNSGNYIDGTNAISFWRWSGVNGARIFTSAPNIEQVDDIPGNGDGVNSQASFLARRDAVRANPTNPSLINFAVFEDGYKNNDADFINFELAYGDYGANGIHQLAIINRTEGQFPFAAAGTANGWADRWEHWQHYYAQAYYLGSNHGVERYSMYNEPDQNSQDVTQADYLNRLQLASDAIQSALSDVNRDFGTSLQPNIIAPITAGGANEYFARLDNSDTRDDNQGWGELVINNLNTNLLGQFDPAVQLIHTYGYQQYNNDGQEYAEDLAFIQAATAEDIDDNDLNGSVKFGLTEFNVHSNGVFSTRSDDLNTPSRYARLGGIFTGLTNQQADELYLFKFDSNAEDNFLQKNGIFMSSRFDSPYNVGSASFGAGVFKLFTKGFVGGQDLLDEPSHGINNLDVAASFNESLDTYFLLSVSESNNNDRTFTFDVSSLGIADGAIVQVEEVSEGNLAEVTQRFPVPANRQIQLLQTRSSVMLISIPKSAPTTALTLTPINDATVRAGTSSNNNFGDSENVFVRNVTDGPNGRSVGTLEFDISQIGNSQVQRAVLEVFGEVNEGDAEFVTTHVFAVKGDSYDEDTITWDDVDNLIDSQGTATQIADNFVSGVGDTAEFVGHLTFAQNSGPVSVDVTDFVVANPASELRFLIAREVRFDGENVDRSAGACRFDSKETSDGTAPQLFLDLGEPLGVAPQVANVEFNADFSAGEAQRSAVESITIAFDSEVTLAPGAVSVIQRSTRTEETFETVTVNVTQELVGSQTVATILFNSQVRNIDGILNDGNYQLTLDASLVTSNGVPMSGDYVLGDTEADGFYTLYGDVDGDRDVDNVDFSFFLQTYFRLAADSSFNEALDYDADGDVDNVDFSFFLGRYFRTLPFSF